MQMSNIQLKNVPEAVHEELRRRAALRGASIRDYVLELIERDQAFPAWEEWIEEVRRLPPLELGGESAADVVRAVRDEREGELERRTRR